MTMKLKLCALSLSLAALYACSGSDDPAPAPPVAEKPFTFKMIGFNDYHGNLESPGTFGTSTAVLAADRPPVWPRADDIWPVRAVVRRRASAPTA